MKDYFTIYKCMNCGLTTHSESIIEIHFRLKHNVYGDFDFIEKKEQHFAIKRVKIISWH